MKKENYTREEVIAIIDKILIHANCLLDAIANEYTNCDGSKLLDLVEQ